MPTQAKSHIHKIKKHLRRHGRVLVKHAKDHFIPHKGNDHHPHVLKHHMLFGYAAIVLLCKSLIIMSGLVYPKMDLQAMALNVANILSLTNQTRQAANLQPLALDAQLTASAQAKAQDMLANQYFEHNSPSGLTPWYWIKRSGYRYIRSAENLAVHYSTAEEEQDAWMTSPSHRKNILNPDFTDTGIGLASGSFEGAETTFVVQHFGKPAPIPQPVDEPKPTTTTVATNKPTTASPQANRVLAAAQDTVASLKPTPKGIIVTIKQPDAQTAKVALGKETADLAKQPDGTWQGEIKNQPIDLSAPGELPLTLTLTDKENKPTSATLAMVGSTAPQGLLGDAVTQAAEPIMLGFITADNLQQTARAISLFLFIFLLLALCLNVFVKLHIQKPKVIAHTLSVIGLIAFLWIL
jgi:hypothetical protein